MGDEVVTYASLPGPARPFQIKTILIQVVIVTQ